MTWPSLRFFELHLRRWRERHRLKWKKVVEGGGGDGMERKKDQKRKV